MVQAFALPTLFIARALLLSSHPVAKAAFELNDKSEPFFRLA